MEAKNLVYVHLPKSLRHIGDFAFKESSNLEEVVFNEGLLTIGEFAFYDCENLKEAKLPATLEVLEGGSFYGCSSLTTVVFRSPSMRMLSELAFPYAVNMSVYGFEGSYAESYARKLNVPFVSINATNK